MNKQIEEMANDLCLCSICDLEDYDDCTVKDSGKCYKATQLAEKLYSKGYRLASEVAREIFEEIEDILNNVGYFDELDLNALKKKYEVSGE